MTNINNNIQESHCSFEVCKLLKEKGFNVLSDSFRVLTDCGKEYWQKEGFLLHENEYLDVTSCPYHDVDEDNLILCPTQTIAIEWIRVNFRIWITVEPFDGNYFKFVIFSDSVSSVKDLNLANHNTPQEATEAALLYVLTNLI